MIKNPYGGHKNPCIQHPLEVLGKGIMGIRGMGQAPPEICMVHVLCALVFHLSIRQLQRRKTQFGPSIHKFQKL
jgi:hypothetical protein